MESPTFHRRLLDSQKQPLDAESGSLVPDEYRQQIDSIVAELASGMLDPTQIEFRRQALHNLAEKIASTDPMTGLKNSRAAEIVIQRCMRSGKPFAIIFVDGDNFGQINKRLGQNTGDEVIRIMAQAATEATRGTDVQARLGEPVENEKVIIGDDEEENARLGGDEFLFVLPGATLDLTPVIFNRFLGIFQRLVAERLTEPQQQEYFQQHPVSVTGGAAQYDETIDRSPLHIMSRGDAAMRYGKQNQYEGRFVMSVKDPYSQRVENRFPSDQNTTT